VGTEDLLTQRYGDDGLGRSYGRNQVFLDANKNAALQNAHISYEILKKYLPQQNQANGLYGLGVSESAAIDAHNDYVTNVGAIEQQYDSSFATLLENYRQARRAEDLKEQERIRTEQDRIRTEQDSAYQEAMAMIESGAYTDADNLDNYLNNMQGRVSDTQYQNLSQLANYYKQEFAEQNATESELAPVIKDDVSFNKNGGRSNFSDGDNFSVKVGDKILRVESRGEVTDSAIVNAARDVINNSVFALADKIYYKINGRIYRIGGRRGNDSANHYSELYKYFFELA